MTFATLFHLILCSSAFLVDPFLSLLYLPNLTLGREYQEIRRKRGTRKGFFQDILSLTKYFIFDGWQHLIDFMLDESPVYANSC